MTTEAAGQTETTEQETPAPEEGTEVEAEATTETTEVEAEAKTFDAEYVKALRKESAGYRDKAKRVDEMGARLHAALVQATGRLQDATDLPYSADHLEDGDTLTAAIDALLTAKPHLATRRVQGTIPQGATPVEDSGVTFGGMLRSMAG